MALERRAHAPAGSLVALVGERHHVGAAQRVDDALNAGGAEVMGDAGQRDRRPDQATCGIRDDLHVHAVPLVFAGVVGLLVSDPVDRISVPSRIAYASLRMRSIAVARSSEAPASRSTASWT